jgi:hypothetical protein
MLKVMFACLFTRQTEKSLSKRPSSGSYLPIKILKGAIANSIQSAALAADGASLPITLACLLCTVR